MQKKYKEETTKPCPNTILSRKGNDYFLSHCIRTIVSDETDEERTCLLGVEQAGVPIDRVTGLSIDRKGLFYLLTIAFGKWIVKELNHSAN